MMTLSHKRDCRRLSAVIMSALCALCTLCDPCLLIRFHDQGVAAAPAALYSPTVTLKALRHPQGSLDALRYLHQLPPSDLELLKSEELLAELDRLLLSEGRSLQVRLWSVALLERYKAARPSLKRLWTQSLEASPELSPAQRQRRLALARAAVRALRGMARADLLSGALSHPDPEVRAEATAAAADPQLLCELALRDPWPQVRRGAIHGLDKIGGESLLCLTGALRDSDERAQALAAQALGELTRDPNWSPEPKQRQQLIRALSSLAGTPSAPLNSRSSALISLGRWGALRPSEQVLKTHLSKGGIIPLALAAVQAIELSSLSVEEKVRRLELALKQSTSLKVRLRAGSSLSRLEAQSADRLLKRAADRVGGREARFYLQLLQPSHGEQERRDASSPDPLVPSLEDEALEGL